jgi:hypothetical protein
MMARISFHSNVIRFRFLEYEVQRYIAMAPLQGTGMELAANVLLAPKCYQQERVHRLT